MSARIFGIALLGACAIACTDVGDSDALPTRSGIGASSGDASADTTVAAPGATSEAGALASDGSGDDQGSVDAEVEVEASADAQAEAGAEAEAGADAQADADAGTDSGTDAIADATSDVAADDSGSVDAADASTGGSVVPCTSAGQTSCIACAGNTSGVCSPTEALFVAHDIAGGHASTTDCYSCLYSSGCLDDTQFGDSNHECGDLSANASACIDTITCVLQTSCSSSDISICFCGAANAGNACQTAANPNGACHAQEIAGLGVSDNATVLKDYTDTTRPAGMANQVFSCAESNGCSACLQ